MYEAFYRLKEKPFSVQPDPDFLYLGTMHGMAYAMLECGVRNRAAFTAICGEVGSGKTTLVRHLLNNLDDDTLVGLVSNPHRGTASLLEWIALAFGIASQGMNGTALYDALQRFLIDQYGSGKRVLLIVDEAQELDAQALEFLRLLSNINADKHQLLQIILVGQPGLRELLCQPEQRRLAQRITSHYFIRALETADVGHYIRHRLKIAGRPAPLFTPEACALVARVSRGIARNINMLCDTALIYGFSDEMSYIDVKVVEKVVRDQIEFGVLVRGNKAASPPQVPPTVPGQRSPAGVAPAMA